MNAVVHGYIWHPWPVVLYLDNSFKQNGRGSMVVPCSCSSSPEL